LDKWVEYADQHPEAGAFGCRVLNPDGSFQDCARPFPTISHYWKVALRLRQNTYRRWNGQTERPIDWQSGCCVMFRGDVLKQLAGFDEQFFYHYEEVDLCYRVRQAGYQILYTPAVVITHLGGQSVGRFPIRFELEKYRNRYRYFYKHYGPRGARQCRRVSLAHLRVRQLGYGLLSLFRKDEATRNRLEMLRTVATWNQHLDPIRFVETGQEPESGHAPLTPPPTPPASALSSQQR
jgi:GT2 family glycosyltransferase